MVFQIMSKPDPDMINKVRRDERNGKDESTHDHGCFFMADFDQAGKSEYGAEVECGHFNEYANIDQQDD